MKTIEETIAQFPQYFGLRSFPGLVFRIGAKQSFIDDSGSVKLYTQSLHHTSELPEAEQRGHNPTGYTWLDFAKGTEAELRSLLAPIPEKWAEVLAKLSDRQEHIQRHQALHACLDELVADFLRHNPRKLPSGTTLVELIEWSFAQTQNPTEASL